MLDLISDIEILIAGAGALVFTFSYAGFFNWRKTQAGRALMYFVLSLDALFLLNGLGRWFGPDYVGREILRPVIYSILVLTIWRLVFVLWKNWRRGVDRPLELETRPRKKETE